MNKDISYPKTKVLIVGGGTAGWMTAAALSNTFNRKQVEITLVESDEISSIGVGEATIPEIAIYNDILGIDENEFLKFCGGTFKLGIEFNHWGKIGDSYMHPFGHYGTKLDVLQFYHYWQKNNHEYGEHDIEQYSICEQAAKRNKFAKPTNIPNSPLSQITYAFHFDASLYAQYLRKYSEDREVIRQEGFVESVNLEKTDGSIREIQLRSGAILTADLYIDCSGFNGLLIEQALNTGYDDWSHNLPCDRAVTVPTENTENPIPYTKATAHTAGWQWRIPLQHRVGNGHVYCSRYMSDDEATQILLDHIDGDTLSEPKKIRFKTGRRRKFWNKNCVAIGLSSGFMEPLESTSIHLIQSSISKLIALFPAHGFNQVEVDKYNQILSDEFEYIRDFLILHYHATERNDSPFWNYCRTMDIPPRLKEKMSLYRSSGRIFRDNFELFDETSWLAVMHGQGLKAKAHHPAADLRPHNVVDSQLQKIREVIQRAADSMPAHAEYIAKHCSATMLKK